MDVAIKDDETTSQGREAKPTRVPALLEGPPVSPGNPGRELLELVELAERENDELEKMHTDRRNQLEKLGLLLLLGIFLVYLQIFYTADFVASMTKTATAFATGSMFVFVLWRSLSSISRLQKRGAAHERALADVLELVRESEGRLPLSGLTRAQIRLRLSKLSIYGPTTV